MPSHFLTCTNFIHLTSFFILSTIKSIETSFKDNGYVLISEFYVIIKGASFKLFPAPKITVFLPNSLFGNENVPHGSNQIPYPWYFLGRLKNLPI